MEEIQQEVEEHVEEQRHAADTLNDGSALKFVFWVPALLLHTLIAAGLVTRVLDFAARSYWLTPFLTRWMWVTAIYFYVGSMVAGLAWSRVLDRWLFKTSRFVWVLPLGIFLYYFLSFAIRANFHDAIAFFFGVRMSFQFLGAVVPLIVVTGYCVGAWIRRTTGEEVPALVESAIGASTENVSAKTAWEKVVELWRAGRRA